MSILFMDNFSNYGGSIAHMKEGVWAASSGVLNLLANPDGVSSGLVLRASDSGAESIRKVFDQGPQTTVGIHVRVYFPELSATNTTFIRLLDQAAATQVGISMDASGYLSVTRGSTVLGTTAAPAIVAGSWIHLELKVVVSETVGTIELRVDERTVIDLENQDTVATSNVEISGFLLGNGTNSTVYFNDLILWNGSGSENNDFLGDYSVVTLLPVSDIALNWATSSGATGYNLIDETLTVDDTDYISADDSPPAASEFGLSDLPADIVSVKALQTVARMLKTDSGTATGQVSLKSGGVLDSGDDHAVSVSATYYVDISELDPDTSALWTPVSVNNASVVIDRTL